MGRMENARLLGGIGAVLTLVGAGFIGFILKLLAVKEIAVETGREEIFKEYLWAAILWIASSLVLAGLFTWYLLRPPSTPDSSLWLIGSATFVAAILMIAAGWFLRESYSKIAGETSVERFSTAGNLYFFGGILTLVLVGIVVVFLAAVFEALAFFSLPDELETSSPVQEPVEF